MLTAGDEFGRTQHGNNNAYAQDNAITWLDWAGRDVELEEHAFALAALRRSMPGLTDVGLLTGKPTAGDGVADVEWLSETGDVLTEAEWNDPARRRLTMVLAVGRGTPGRPRQWRPALDGLFAVAAKRSCMGIGAAGRRQRGTGRRGKRLAPAGPHGCLRSRTTARMMLAEGAGMTATDNADWWRGARHLSGLSPLFPGFDRRRQRRSRRHYRAAFAISPRWASMRSGCRRSSSRRWPTWATTCRTIAPSIRCSARLPISTR